MTDTLVSEGEAVNTWVEPEKHDWLDAGLVAEGEPLRQLVQRTLEDLARDEVATKRRERARSKTDQRLHAQRVEIVVANLAYAVLHPPKRTGRLAVDTQNRKATRYDHKALNGKTLRALLSVLVKLDIVDWRIRPKAWRGEKGSIAPTDGFKRRVEELGVSLEDFRHEERGELVILTHKVDTPYSWLDEQKGRYAQERIDYKDNPTTVRIRRDMEAVNKWLSQADVSFIDDGGPMVESRDRSMTRRFVVYGDDKPKFNTSGRLFGGFWLNLKRSRRAGIRINGEAIADLDYKSMFPRLAYAHVKAVPPMDDLYDIEELRGYRSGVKLAVLVLFFAGGGRKRWPRSMGVGVGSDVDAADGLVPAAEYEYRLPSKDWTVHKMIQALSSKHPPLVECFNTDIGHRLMFMESELLVSVLLRLMKVGIVALPIHDGLMVPMSRGQEAKVIMEETALERFGISFPVTVE